MVFSYILGDNFLYRLAVYVFVGLTAGFIAVVTVESVILPWIDATIVADNAPTSNVILGLIPFALGVLLLLKTSPRLGPVGNISIAFIIGVGTAVALVGAVAGVIIPLADTTAEGVNANTVNSYLVVAGVISSLVYFQFLAKRRADGQIRRGPVSLVIGTIGQGVIVVTLGALYAAAILTSLTIVSERLGFIFMRINGS